jgi:hypothetical protein
MRLFGRTAAGALIVLLAAIAIACGGDDKNEEQSAAATPSQPDPAVLAQQAADAMEAVNSLHFLLEHENGGTPIVLNLNMTRAEGDLVKPDRLRADVEAKATQLGNANVNVKAVNVGDELMVTNPFNSRQWVTVPGDNRLASIFDPAAGTTAALRSVKNPRITGEETINGVKVWRIEGDVDAGELQEALSTVAEPGYTAKGTAWVGQEQPLVYRIRLEGPLGPKDPQNIVRKLDLSNFDENVSIELPSS